jgi:hypothetical protein
MARYVFAVRNSRPYAGHLLIAAIALSTWGGSFAPPARAQWTERVRVPHAAYAVENAPSALVHAPARFDPAPPLHLVVFLHGLMGCAEVLMNPGRLACQPGGQPYDGWDLARAHDAADRNTLLIIPQLAFMRRDGRPGCFGKKGCFRAFLAELLDALPRGRLPGRRTLNDVASIALVAHSAGYRTALAITKQGEVAALVRDVVLLDALYGEVEGFLSWIAAGNNAAAHLVSLHIGRGAPARNSAWLLRATRRKVGADRVTELDERSDGPDFRPALRDDRVIVARVKGPHKLVPETYLTGLLKALELPPKAPSKILSP